jgi:hypothetical protein
MMHARFLASTAPAIIVLALAAGGCRSTGDAQSENAGTAAEAPDDPVPALAPLVVDAEAPLLLDEPAEQGSGGSADAADNSPCFVCHANYRQEALAVRHAESKMGCVACHGDSFAHRNDENNTTPPEKMFARDAVEAACGKCHTTHDVAPREVIARFRKRGLEAADIGTIVCTDCHGDHRLKVRTVQWNKKTGELL